MPDPAADLPTGHAPKALGTLAAPAYAHRSDTRLGGHPAQHLPALVEGDVPMLGQLGGVERIPRRRGGLEGGIALVDSGP